MAFYAPHPLRKPHIEFPTTSPIPRSKPIRRTSAQKNASRERMQAELAELRLEASCLELELAKLQQKRRKRASRGGRLLDNYWMNEAEQQRMRRLRAEIHNRRLRNLMQGHSDAWSTLSGDVTTKLQGLVTTIEHAQVLSLPPGHGADSEPYINRPTERCR